MKAIFTTAFAALLIGASSLFAQTAIAPEAGATKIGSFTMDLDALSEPQPDLQYAVDNGGGSTITTVWLTSEGEPVVTVTTDEVQAWKSQDPVYNSATTSYTYDKLSAVSVWMAHEKGYDVGPETKVKLVKSVDNTSQGERKCLVLENGTNTEVKVQNPDGTY